MRNRVLVIMLASMTAVWGVAGSESGAPLQAPSARDVYVNKGCHFCHGYDGQGAVSSGPRLAPGPIPWDDFVNFARRPPNVMPAYPPELVSGDELEKIYEYLQSIPEPPDAGSIPAFADASDP